MVNLRDLTGRRKKYKAQTDTLTTWLVANACNLPDQPAIIQKRATTVTQGKSVKIPVDDLPLLAQALHDAEVRLEVPARIIAAAQDAIGGRQEMAKEFRAKAKSGRVSEADESHSHFINILKDVLFTLRAINKPSVQYQETTKRKGCKEIDDEQSVDSACSTSAEPPDETIPVCTAAAPVEIDLSGVYFTLDAPMDDIRFALQCHLADMRDVRNAVRRVWLDYARGETSILLATMVTDAAFCLLKASDDAFVDQNPSLRSFKSILSLLDLSVFNLPGQAAYSVFTKKPGKPAVQSMDDIQLADSGILDLLCVGSSFTLDVFTRQCQRVIGQSATKKGKPAIPEDSGCSQGLDNEMGRIFGRNVMALLSHPEPEGEDANIDEFVQALGDLGTHDRLWIIYSTQIYEDLLKILGRDSCSAGLSAFKQSIDQCKSTATSMKQFNNDNANLWLEATVASLREASKLLDVDTTVFDAGQVFATDYEQQLELKRQVRQNVWLDGLESQLPTRVGGSLYQLKASMLYTGCQVANEHLAVHCVAYIYTAARYNNLLPRDHVWPDMDWFIESQASIGPLVPDLSSIKTPKELFTAFYVAAGSTVSNKKDLKNYGWDYDPIKVTKIRIGGYFTAELLRTVGAIKEGSCQRSVSSSKVLNVVLKQYSAVEGGGNDLPPNLTPAQLLATFEDSFRQDETALNFDYFEFWMECSRIMDGILTDVLERKTAAASEHGAFAVVTHDILSEMVYEEERRHWWMLNDAARYLKKYISKDGSRHLTEARVKAREVCSSCGQAKVPLRRCGKCKASKYCDCECQKKDWKKHKLFCGKMA